MDLGHCVTSLPIPNSQRETSGVLNLLTVTHKPILTVLHCPPKHTIARQKGLRTTNSCLLSVPLHVDLSLETWVLVLLVWRKEAWHLKSKGKILTKTKVLNSFPSLQQTNKQTNNSIRFPHFKAFPVRREDWKEREAYAQHRPPSCLEDRPMLKCFINKVLVSRGEHTVSPLYCVLHVLSVNHALKIQQRSTSRKGSNGTVEGLEDGGAGPKSTRGFWLKWSHGYSLAKRFWECWDAGDQGVATAAGGAPWKREAFGKARRNERCSKEMLDGLAF